MRGRQCRCCGTRASVGLDPAMLSPHMSWSPSQYLKFSQPRLRPAMDLLARIPSAEPRCVYDLGCGAGNVTAALVQRWPQARILGVDTSAAMLAQAAKRLPEVQWVQHSLADWQPDTPAD